MILATNIAETSLTVPGVRPSWTPGCTRSRATIRPGRSTASRSSASRRTRPISAPGAPAALPQERSGGCGTRRTACGRSAEAEIHRVDLAAVVLAVLAWGGDPHDLAWFEAPARYSLDAAFELLRGLGAVSGARITAMGASMQRLPLHPRLARILLAAEGAGEAALACALLSERHYASAASHRTSSDLQTIVDNRAALPAHITRVARQLSSLVVGRPTSLDERSFRRALFAGYPDRLARRRAAGSPKALLASGHGAYVGPESGVRDGEFLIAIDVTASQTADGSEARIRMAAIVDREWLEPTDVRLRACVRRELGDRSRDGARVLRRRRPLRAHRPAGGGRGRALLAGIYVQRRLGADDQQLLRRLRFAGLDLDVPGLVRAAAYGKRSLDDIDIADALTWEQRSQLDREAPARLPLPSGRSAPLEYREDGSVVAPVKLQEMFGVLESPRIGGAPGAGPARAARPERPAGAAHTRSAQLLGDDVPGGAQGAARPLPEAQVAGESVRQRIIRGGFRASAGRPRLSQVWNASRMPSRSLKAEATLFSRAALSGCRGCGTGRSSREPGVTTRIS